MNVTDPPHHHDTLHDYAECDDCRPDLVVICNGVIVGRVGKPIPREHPQFLRTELRKRDGKSKE